MNRKIKYTNEPVKARVIKDFLPAPETLVLREQKKRVTLTLSESSINYFKQVARQHNASYQGMIRQLLDYYVTSQKNG